MEISPEMAGWIAVAALLVTVGIGIPVAYAMGVIGFVGSYLLLAPEPRPASDEVFGTVFLLRTDGVTW